MAEAAALQNEVRAFLFTDIEGSTRLWERHPQAMSEALAMHDTLLRGAVEDAGGTVVKTTGDGLMAAFAVVGSAITATLEGQRALAAASWGETGPLRARIGVHAGEAHASDGDFHGPTVNRTARIMAVGHGGQVLISQAAVSIARDQLPEGAALRDLGEHRLKDLQRPERLYQLVHPDLPADFPPLMSLNERPNNLPTQSSAFVGREHELEGITDLLAGSVRLLTLTGPGGTGKTRLALQAAADQIERFEDGVFFVDLASTRDREDVLATLIRTLGLEETEAAPRLDDLTRQLRGRELLLLLDNFEQVARTAPMVAELLEACPQLRVLATSREPLRVRGEQVLAVPTLGLPTEAGSGTSGVNAEEAARWEAVQLFVDRARAVNPSFELTDDNAAAVIAICARLDGLPLALELAAARLNLFSPQALLDRLGGGTGVLGGGARDLPQRQQTLRDTIAWSYDLLDEADRLLFQVLSAFSGIGFDAAEGTVARLASDGRAGVPDEIHRMGVIDGLASLLDKSLLRREEDLGGSPRFGMLRTIDDFATERLEERPALADAVRAAHATYFAGFAASRWGSVGRRKRSEVADELVVELDNLRAAWAYWVQARDLDRLDQLIDGLWLIYDTLGWHQATVAAIEDLLAVLAGAPETPERIRQQIELQMSLARVYLSTRGYTAEVEQPYQRALELAERGGELPDMFSVLRSLSVLHNFRMEFGRAEEVGRRMLEIAEVEQDPGMLLEAHLTYGSSIAFSNDMENGLAHLEQAAELIDADRESGRRFRFGPHPGVSTLTTTAILQWIRGYPDRSRQRADRALSLAAELDHPLTTAYARYHVGLLSLWMEEFEVAAELARGVRAVSDEYDLTLWRALSDCLEGAVTAFAGDPGGLERFETGLSVYDDLTTPPVFGSLLTVLHAQVLAVAGRPAEGSAMLDEAMAVEAETPNDSAVLMPDFAIAKGDLVLAASSQDRDEAIAWYERALEVAGALDVLMPRLRAATRLYRLHLEDPDARGTSHGLLQDAYDRFSEGWGAAPVREAEGLLRSEP